MPIIQEVPGPATEVTGAAADTEFGADLKSAGSAAGAPARPYGRILIFTLLDDKAADFDRLAEETAEEVRTGEPDTLVYVIHLVPNAPMQRIFYEIYRDRTAFESHENKAYMQRFVAERRAYVLATNVIELRVKYAKVAPLPADPRPLSVTQAVRPQLPPGRGPVGPSPAPPPRPTPSVPVAVQRPAAEAATQRPAPAGGPRPQPSGAPRYGRA
jgi:quinol monooxygenase YgiN